MYTRSMTQIEDTAGNTAEVSDLGEHVELTTGDEVSNVYISLVLTPRQARALARQLLQQADESEYGA
jgi:hypothetical protein